MGFLEDMMGGDSSFANDLLLQSAIENIMMQAEISQQTFADLQPFYESGLQGLQRLQGLAGQGPSDYKPSALYNLQLQKGTENIQASQAKGGLLHSSATGEKTAGLAQGLLTEDIGRYRQNAIEQVQMAQQAAGIIGQGMGVMGGNVGGALSGLGSGLNLLAQNQGQRQQSLWGSMGGALSGLGMLGMQQGW